MNILKYEGGKISVPGIYNLTMDQHHSDICAGSSISSSGLRKIILKSPLHYWDESYLNPEQAPQEDKESYIWGRATHHLLLGEKNFYQHFVVMPREIKEATGKGSRNAKWDWEEAQTLPILKPDDIEDIKGRAAQLAKHPIIKQGLLSGLVEHSMIWQDKETGVWLRSRPDAIPIHADAIVDYKGTRDASRLGCWRAVREYGYHMQLSLAGIGIEVLLGKQIPADGYVLVFQEWKRPYAVNIKPLDAGWIGKGRELVRTALRQFADSISSGEWAGYPDDMETLNYKA